MAMKPCSFLIKLALLLWCCSHHGSNILQRSRCVGASTDTLYWSRYTFNFPPLFSFLSWQWKNVLIDIWSEKKWLYLWRNAVIFKDKQATANWKRKSLLYSPFVLGPEESLSHLMGIQQPPDDILNIIAPLGRVCLFGVYIWKTERRELAKLFIALKVSR